jgi:hypothetical protein
VGDGYPDVCIPEQICRDIDMKHRLASSILALPEKLMEFVKEFKGLARSQEGVQRPRIVSPPLP